MVNKFQSALSINDESPEIYIGSSNEGKDDHECHQEE